MKEARLTHDSKYKHSEEKEEIVLLTERVNEIYTPKQDPDNHKKQILLDVETCMPIQHLAISYLFIFNSWICKIKCNKSSQDLQTTKKSIQFTEHKQELWTQKKQLIPTTAQVFFKAERKSHIKSAM